MLSRTSEYALRAVVWLSSHPGELSAGQGIARDTKVPAGYFAKVMQALVRSGLVDARRGRHGGFTLACPPERIRLLDVINAVDPVRRIHGCPLGLARHRVLCPLHRKLNRIAAQLERSYRGIRISDLQPRAALKPGRTAPRVSRA